MNDNIESRALDIAAAIIAAAGICRYEDPGKCKRLYADNETCRRCVKAWIKNRAKQELKRETKQRVGSKGE